ncbi:MAG: alpha/beta hydrolase [Solirubrobacteraceae bacterium]|nr:alpha/beta hydrolase [Patulibacter sp.]
MGSGTLSTLDVRTSAGVVHVVSGGDPRGDPVVFLHGWPESWRAWETVMELAIADGYRAIALDLPGIGHSTTAATDGTKSAVVEVLREVLADIHVARPTLVGHDAGGMVVHPYLVDHGDELARAVIMDVVIPGIGPWEAVRANPYVWHFAFHAIPELPERLVEGRVDEYFDYFWSAVSAVPEAITPELRSAHVGAYSSPASLKAGFDWYRAFPADAAHNAPGDHPPKVTTPLLYLRGEHEGGDMDEYVAGFHAAGLEHVTDARIPGAGHFAPEEAPVATWHLIRDFVRRG